MIGGFKMENKINELEKVCISFKELYLENGSDLYYGGYIDFYSDEDNEYYDLRNADPDDMRSELIACDGEEHCVLSKDEKCVILRNIESRRTVFLSVDEFAIAAFK